MIEKIAQGIGYFVIVCVTGAVFVLAFAAVFYAVSDVWRRRRVIWKERKMRLKRDIKNLEAANDAVCASMDKLLVEHEELLDRELNLFGEEKRAGVLSEVAAERNLQDDKWGEQDHGPAVWLTILGEEFGEACKAALEGVPLGETEDYREELIQTAAVATAAVESLDRQEEKN